jgi:hydrogenase-4 component B
VTGLYGAAMIALVAGAAAAGLQRRSGALLSAAGALLLAVVGFHAALGAGGATLDIGGWLGFGHSALVADRLGGLFLALAGVSGAAVSLALAELPASRLAGVLHGSILVLIAVAIGADNGFLFLLAWEGLTVCIYLLVSADAGRPGRLVAGYLTGGLTKIGGAALLAAFAILYAHTGSFQLSSWAAAAPRLGVATRGALFALFLAGFGTKVGILPLQGALPVGYWGAPRAAAATLAVALAAGFYGLWRFIVQLLAPAPSWWGDALLVLGALSAFSGILYAITQNDLRRFLGFSTIEHTGITLLGLGVALLGQANHSRTLLAAGLLAASLEVAAHALAKTLALLAVDRIERATGEGGLDSLGGLGRRLRGTAAATLAATLTLAAMPPLAGFVSEWFTLEALLQAFRMHTLLARLLCALAAAVLALTAGLGVLAFAKLYGFTFLSSPREGVRPVGEPSRWGVSIGALGVLVAGLGVVAPWEIHLLGSGLRRVIGFDPASYTISHPLVLGPVFAKFSVLAPTWLAIVLPALSALGGLLARGVDRRGARTAPVWVTGSGARLASVQYRPAAYSNPIRYVLRRVLGYERTVRAGGAAAAGAGAAPGPASAAPGPASAAPGAESTGRGAALVVETRVVLAVERLVYQPLARGALALSTRVRRAQSGRLSDYLLYMLAVVIVVLALIPILY